MRIVLGKTAGTGQTVDHAGLFVAVDGTELKEAQRQLAVGTATGCKNQVVHRAVHGLGVVVLRLLDGIAFFVILAIELHWWEHSIGVEVQVARLLEESTLGDMRSVDKGIAGLDVAVARVVFHLHAHGGTIRVEYRETGANLIWEGEEV